MVRYGPKRLIGVDQYGAAAGQDGSVVLGGGDDGGGGRLCLSVTDLSIHTINAIIDIGNSNDTDKCGCSTNRCKVNHIPEFLGQDKGLLHSMQCAVETTGF